MMKRNHLEVLDIGDVSFEYVNIFSIHCDQFLVICPATDERENCVLGFQGELTNKFKLCGEFQQVGVTIRNKDRLRRFHELHR